MWTPGNTLKLPQRTVGGTNVNVRQGVTLTTVNTEPDSKSFSHPVLPLPDQEVGEWYRKNKLAIQQTNWDQVQNVNPIDGGPSSSSSSSTSTSPSTSASISPEPSSSPSSSPSTSASDSASSSASNSASTSPSSSSSPSSSASGSVSVSTSASASGSASMYVSTSPSFGP